MKTFSIDLPALFGDHHVTEIHRLLGQLSGVTEIYASSSFKYAEITYDEGKTNEEEIKKALEEAGYLGELPILQETNIPAQSNGDTNFRHTAYYQQTGNEVSFSQKVAFQGRALWPCPGIGPVKTDMGED